MQDDWKVNRALTVFLGLRYEIVGTWHEDGGLLANFILDDGGHHVVPSAEVAAKLPPGLIALDRTLLASEAGLPDTLLNTDKNNFSPRVGFAWRLDESNKTVLRGGFGLFHPTVAVQGIRDLLATNEFRYTTAYRGGGLRNGFSGGVPFTDPDGVRQPGHRPDLEAPDIYQYNLTVERELPGDMGLRVSYIGSTSRKLLNDVDFNTLPASTVPFINDGNPEDAARLPYAPYGSYMDIVGNRAEGRYDSLQLELQRRWKGGFAVNAAYTLAHSDSNAPDTGNSTIGPVQFDPYDIEKDRGPDPNVVKHRLVANATWDIPVGRGRKHGADMAAWSNALFGGWTVSTIVQARSGQNLTPFFSSYYTTTPWNTGKPLDGLGNFFCCAWRPDQIKESEHRWIARRLLRPDRLCDSGGRQARECEEGKPERPRHLGRELRLLQGHRRDKWRNPGAVLDDHGQRVQPPAVLPGLWERLRPARRLPGQRRSDNGTNRSAGGRHHSQHGRILPRTRHTTRVTRHVLAGHRPVGPRPAIGHLGARFGVPRV